MISIVVISKDESALEYTIGALLKYVDECGRVELVVVDASEGRLDHMRSESAIWIDFPPVAKSQTTIPHQRNEGVRRAGGNIIVFTDAGCDPQPGWLEALTGPIASGKERVVSGVAISRRAGGAHGQIHDLPSADEYVDECPTINLAFERGVFDDIGGFDESFEYGSDVDFAWRIRERGIPILRTPSAVVVHDWGGRKRQAKRSYVYGQARARLYRKHPHRIRRLLSDGSIALIYPLFLLGLPLSIKFRKYPLLLIVPLWKNAGKHPVSIVVDHLLYGAGVLRESASWIRQLGNSERRRTEL